MATTKITVSMPVKLVSYIREQVAAGHYDSVSAYVTRAADNYRTFDPLELLILSMVAETGEPDAEAEAWADSVLDAAERAARARDTDVGDADIHDAHAQDTDAA